MNPDPFMNSNPVTHPDLATNPDLVTNLDEVMVPILDPDSKLDLDSNPYL
jgi:hypothetical protein